MKYFFKLMGFIRPYTAKFIIGMFIYASQGFAFPFMLSIFVSNILTAVTGKNASGVLDAGIVLGIMVVSFIAIISLGIYMTFSALFGAEYNIKRRLFTTFTSAGIEDAKHSGEGIAAINTDANTAMSLFENPLMFFLNTAMIIPVTLVVVFVAEWRLGFALLGVGGLIFILQHRFTKPLAEIGKRRLEENAENVKTASNIFSGAITIRSYNIQPQALVTFDNNNKQLKFLDIRHAFITMWQNTITTLEGILSLVVVFGLGGYFVATGQMDFPLLVVVYLMGRSLISAIGRIGQTFADLQPPLAAAKRVFDTLEELENIPIYRKSGQDKHPSGYRLQLNDFNFAYRDTNVLNNINLDIEENTMIALVGESGSGKSTLLRAIIGMYEREELGLKLGGISYNDASIESWRKSFAYVDQSCKLFDISIKENILMGNENATDEEIESAAKIAAAHDFIMELDDGYNTLCGEKGANISGGQKQRVAIARALVRKAPILVFDEATSSLDKDSERQIMETIEGLRDNHTILITTHNLDTITKADKIVVLENGKIADIGTHDILIEKGGLYKRLFETQKI